MNIFLENFVEELDKKFKFQIPFTKRHGIKKRIKLGLYMRRRKNKIS